MSLGTMMQNISKPSKFDDLEDVLGFLRRPQLFEIKRGASEPLSQRKMWKGRQCTPHREPEHDLVFEDRGSARNNLMHFHNRRKIKQNVLRTSAFEQRLLKSISRFSRPPKYVENWAFQDCQADLNFFWATDSETHPHYQYPIGCSAACTPIYQF